jgi:hypothetical protein
MTIYLKRRRNKGWMSTYLKRRMNKSGMTTYLKRRRKRGRMTMYLKRRRKRGRMTTPTPTTRCSVIIPIPHAVLTRPAWRGGGQGGWKYGSVDFKIFYFRPVII